MRGLYLVQLAHPEEGLAGQVGARYRAAMLPVTSAHTLPDWIVYLQALGPLLIGVAVAIVAFLQWRTAKRKLALDLFDKRFAWYSAVKDHLYVPLNDGPDPAREAFLAFVRLADEAYFLFGPEIQARLNPIHDLAMALSVIQVSMRENRANDRAEALERYVPMAVSLRDDLPRLLAPYMKMDQKR
jgi:hypothetical protein